MPYSKPFAFASLPCTICQCLILSGKTKSLKEQCCRHRNGCQVLNTVTAQALSSCLLDLHVKALLTTLGPLSQPLLLRELCLMSSSSVAKSCTPSLLQQALDQDFGDSYNFVFLMAGMTQSQCMYMTLSTVKVAVICGQHHERKMPGSFQSRSVELNKTNTAENFQRERCKFLCMDKIKKNLKLCIIHAQKASVSTYVCQCPNLYFQPLLKGL